MGDAAGAGTCSCSGGSGGVGGGGGGVMVQLVEKHFALMQEIGAWISE